MQQFLGSLIVHSNLNTSDLWKRVQAEMDNCPFGTIDVADLVHDTDCYHATLKITVNTIETVSSNEVLEEINLMIKHMPLDKQFVISRRIVTEN